MDAREASSVILFDGECNFCNRAVQFVLRRDPAGHFQFASLRSPAAQRLLQQAGIKRESLPDSMVLVEGGNVYTQSTAALRIVRRLSGLWPLLSLCLLIPRVLRDAVYNLIARNRHRLIRGRQTCMLPTPEMHKRFLSE